MEKKSGGSAGSTGDEIGDGEDLQGAIADLGEEAVEDLATHHQQAADQAFTEEGYSCETRSGEDIDPVYRPS